MGIPPEQDDSYLFVRCGGFLVLFGRWGWDFIAVFEIYKLGVCLLRFASFEMAGSDMF